MVWETAITTLRISALAICAWTVLGACPAAAQTIVPAVALTATMYRSHIEVAAAIQAQQSAALAAARSGTVTKIYFASGAQVAAGTILLQLANAPEAAQLALDQARLTQTGRDFSRTQKLMSISGASQSALEQAAAANAEAAAQVGLDQANLAQLQLVAPFAGIVGIRGTDVGDYVQAGTPIVTLTAPGPLRVLFSVPQSEAAALAIGDSFALKIPTAGTQIAVSGSVAALSPALNPATNARDVEGLVPATPGILSGMFGVVDIATGAPTPAFTVPSTALNDSALGPYLYLIQNNVLHAVYVTIDGTAGGSTIISAAGLNPGQKIVAIGGFKLTDGQTVTPQAP